MGGILPIEVLEARIAEISVNRYNFRNQEQENGFLKESVLRSWSPVKAGDVLQQKPLDDFVSLLNLNPDRHISAVASGSAEPNALDLAFDVYETDPWHWFLQVDNSGTEERQWAPRLVVINTNFSGIDDRFSAVYQAPWERGIEDEYSVFGSYDFPLLEPRLHFSVYAGYSQFDITPEGGMGLNFLGNGSFFGAVASYNVLQISGWFVNITTLVSEERSKVTPSLGLASNVDMDLWGVGANAHRSDDLSNTFLTLNGTMGIGGSSREEFQRARINTDPDFTVYDLTASHSQFMDPGKVNRLTGTFRFVASDERLVPAKMTAFGVLYSVRGYKEDEIVADGGLLLRGQYEFDIMKYEQPATRHEANSMKAHGEEPWLKKFAPLVFVDYGRAKIKNPVPGEKGTRELCSVGVGVIAEVTDDFSSSTYCGWPLEETDETAKGDLRLSVSLVARF